MAERDCSKHTKKVTVKADEVALNKVRHSNIVAGILRVIAEYTDGFCAVEYAKDDNLGDENGMRFWFRDEEKRALFKKRIPLYIEEEANSYLKVT